MHYTLVVYVGNPITLVLIPIIRSFARFTGRSLKIPHGERPYRKEETKFLLFFFWGTFGLGGIFFFFPLHFPTRRESKSNNFQK